MLCLVLIMIAACLCVSAADLTAKDCGNYTIDVPADSSFEDVSFYPAGTPVHMGGSGASSLSAPQDAKIHGERDKVNNFAIFYLDAGSGDNSVIKSADGYRNSITDYGGVKQDSDKGYDIYKYPDKNDFKYEIVVQDKGFLSLLPQEKIVILMGDDLDLLTQMADSVKFN